MTILADTSYIDQINEILQAKRKESEGELAICPKGVQNGLQKILIFL